MTDENTSERLDERGETPAEASDGRGELPSETPEGRGEQPEAEKPPGDFQYDEWSITDDEYTDASYVGTATGGIPVYHSEGTIFHGEPNEDEETISAIPDSERSLGPGNALGDVLAEIGDTIGWESLSAFGEEHHSRDRERDQDRDRDRE